MMRQPLCNQQIITLEPDPPRVELGAVPLAGDIHPCSDLAPSPLAVDLESSTETSKVEFQRAELRGVPLAAGIHP